MFSLCKRWCLEIEDWLRYQPSVRRAIGRCKLWRTRRPDPGDSQAVARAIVQLCAAARLAGDDALERRIQERIVALTQHVDGSRLDWTEFVHDFHDPRMHKAVVLKPYIGPHEKGVVFISFEGQWVKLLSRPNPGEFSQRYSLVLAPSSSPHNLINYLFPRLFGIDPLTPGPSPTGGRGREKKEGPSPTGGRGEGSAADPIFTLISNPHDRDVLPGVSSRLDVVPLYASHWVNPDLYQPLPKTERAYDLLMVASWGKVKRHQAFFSALRTMPRDLRVLLVGQDQEGRDADTIRKLARWYGVEDRFTIRSNVPYREVTKLFCQARASVVLSKREGSCVVVAESLFADAPVAILRGAEIGSRIFLNEQTGCFLDENNLAHDLTGFVKNADRYQPRAWAEANISCFRSTQVLNDHLKEHALEQGEAWTENIAPMQWAPDPRLLREEDRARLAGERQDILARFGLEIGPPPLQ